MIRWQTTMAGGTALSCVALAAPAVALEIPKPGNLDNRIRYVPYEPGNVVDPWTVPGAVMVVEFGEG